MPKFRDLFCKLLGCKILRCKLLSEDAGQDLIEYALIAALVALTAIASVRSVGTAVSHAFTDLGTSVTGDV